MLGWCSNVTSLNLKRWFVLCILKGLEIHCQCNYKIFIFRKEKKFEYSEYCEYLGRKQLQNDVAEEKDNDRISYR